ncbi:uncharacterized protein TRIADDRAFT_57018 [Trichoplax adhaerens]|uniref:5'-nucleotidase n=1 Tax=Trichoplax adhaerens TaxID=10228 RepID=B3RX71_TRIAD|nr:hypothetical protein TRIADDRAFT_57018 [Trichoplax adhaerens]EDV25256.1 hypothetical protein TRIADDRAFT_57018 [Trichoplax adhaerens]|eukprot:XP_002113146.1 hypothetical protein TRIADDRAFT_57018 [Trichoplax adhaerens]
MQKLITINLTFLFIIACVALSTTADFNLTILHTNDVHARFEEANRFGGSCSSSDAQNGRCFGGVARRATMINKIRGERSSVLLLDAGDQFQGTLWFYVFKGTACSNFMNQLGYSAMALGNHEFDNKVSGLLPFLENTTFPILSANINASKTPALDSKLSKSTTFTFNGQKVGVIGYITADTTEISNPGPDVIFNSVIAAVQEEATKLAQQGINIIIALGHAGFDMDKAIADKVVGVDIVVGGHTDTFLYTGTPPSNEVPVGPYPTVINPSYNSSRKVLVVQDFYFGKYLGDLQVVFDNFGEVKSYGGNPILLNSSIAKDGTVQAMVTEYKKQVTSETQKEIGKTYVFLDGQRSTVRLRESNLGNLITDAMVHQYLKNPTSASWTDVGIAVMNGGGIRSPIDPTRPPGAVTVGDILTVLPFRNSIDVLEIKGMFIRQALEVSVRDYSTISTPGRFLQMSGLRVTYNLNNNPMNRVVKVEARCNKCNVPSYGPLIDNQNYKIAINTFLASGGDGYYMFRDNRTSYQITGYLDTDVVTTYVKKLSPINIGIEDRIRFINQTASPPQPTSTLPGCVNSAITMQQLNKTLIFLISLILILAIN